jgi:hypothetical protein
VHIYVIQLDFLHVKLLKGQCLIYTVFKTIIVFYRTLNDEMPVDEWVYSNFERQLNLRQSTFIVNRHNNLLVWMNAMASRFFTLNNQIPSEWLNETHQKFKLYCKE